jgi:hypothetical protein
MVCARAVITVRSLRRRYEERQEEKVKDKDIRIESTSKKKKSLW